MAKRDSIAADFDAITRDGLTDEECVVADALACAVNGFAVLKRQYPDELRDFTDAIYRCQDALAQRIARRHYPNKGGQA